MSSLEGSAREEKQPKKGSRRQSRAAIYTERSERASRAS